MKLANAIKKAEKATGNKAVKNGQFYFFKFGLYTLSFAVNGRMSEDAQAINYKTVKGEDKTDTMSDYFDGVFHNNLNQALKYIGA